MKTGEEKKTGEYKENRGIQGKQENTRKTKEYKKNSRMQRNRII